MGKLTLKIIEKYNLPTSKYTPDYDDAGFLFQLPSGIELSGLFMCNGSPCKMDMLEGLDGYICIDTEEELIDLIAKEWDQIMDDLEKENPDFDRNEY